MLTSSNGNPESVVFGSAITLTCTVELNSTIMMSDLSLLNVSAQLTHPNGTMLSLSNTVTGTAFTYTIQLDSFSITDVGNYTCNANINPQSSATYLNGNIVLPSVKIRVVTGEIISA